MLRCITSACRAGGAVNEDGVGFGANYLFVVDGASGLYGRRLPDEPSDAAWLTRCVCEGLHRFLPDEDLSLEAVLHRAVDELPWTAEPEAKPSAGLTVFRARGGVLEGVALGDCPGSVELRSGGFAAFDKTPLTRLDGIALAEMVRLHFESGLTMAEAREAIQPMLQKHRSYRNRAGGYWILEPGGEGIAHARTLRVPLTEVRSVFVCSDGFYQLVGFGEARDLPALHRLCAREGAEALTDRLFALQEADRALLRLPRFKFRDDTTAALAVIE